MLRRAASLLGDWIWPPRCLACDERAAAGALCDVCVETLVPGTGVCCPRCGGVWLTPPATVGHTCGECRASPPPFERARAAYAYGGALRDAISRWKNVPDSGFGPPLAGLLAGAAEAAGWLELPDDLVVVPVPAHWRRARRRGFNPAGVLARRLARALGRPLAHRGLRALREVPPSRGLGRKARLRRLRGVFAADRRAVAGRPVLLVDDVMTTGATARSASAGCLRAGAVSVEVAVLARAPWD